MPVNFVRKELNAVKASYALIRDCIGGEQAVKAKKTTHLPMPNSDDQSQENLLRYNDYLTRAVFYGATGRTLLGFVGQIFMREPQIEVPATLKPLVDDATGLGVDIEQLAKEAAGKAIGFGRLGLLIDYPSTEGFATKAEIDAASIRPTFTLYEPDAVINWRVASVGGKQKLTLVVLEENAEKADDGFEVTYQKQWRVLRLVGGVYQQEIWTTEHGNSPQSIAFPKDAAGQPIDTLPFIFIGSENNDPSIDPAPLYDLASLNIAHYRNSADYEESCFICGQPTPYFAGLTQDWVSNVFKGKILLGARSAVPLPEGATAGLLQAEPNTMPFEAMGHKERLMVAIGAKLVEQKQVQRTATEAGAEEAAEASTLATVAKNVSQAFLWGLAFATRYVGGEETGLKFELNTEFDLVKLTPEERKTLLAEWQAGGLAWEEYRASLRRAGIATLEDQEAKDKIAEEMANAPGLEDDPALGGPGAKKPPAKKAPKARAAA